MTERFIEEWSERLRKKECTATWSHDPRTAFIRDLCQAITDRHVAAIEALPEINIKVVGITGCILRIDAIRAVKED